MDAAQDYVMLVEELPCTIETFLVADVVLDVEFLCSLKQTLIVSTKLE